MKKIILAIFCVLLTSGVSFAASAIVKQGIATYKSGNYVGAFNIMSKATSRDPGDALAQYYYAISAVQIGDKQTASKAYNAVLMLNSNKYLVSLAQKGLAKLGEVSAQGNASSAAAASSMPSSAPPSANSLPAVPVMEHIDSYMTDKKLQSIKETINQSGQIDPAKLQNIKDLTPSANKKSELPTQEEIIKAYTVLVKAGLNPSANTNTAMNPMMPQSMTAEDMQMNMLMSSMGGGMGGMGGGMNNSQSNMLPLMMMLQQGNGSDPTSKNNNSEAIKSMITGMMMPNMGMFSSSNDNQNNY